MKKRTQKRVSKSKNELVSDIQLRQDAERRRALIRDIIFPYLVEMKENIGYSKVFLQAYASIIGGVYEEVKKKTTVGHLKIEVTEKIKSLFDTKDPEQKKEMARYIDLTEKLHDVSIQDLNYATELPRYLDGFVIKNREKSPISEIDINQILG